MEMPFHFFSLNSILEMSNSLLEWRLDLIKNSNAVTHCFQPSYNARSEAKYFSVFLCKLGMFFKFSRAYRARGRHAEINIKQSLTNTHKAV